MKRYFSVSWRVAVIFLIVWFIVASILLNLWPIVRTEGGWATISNLQYGFTVDYPTIWKAEIYDDYGYRGVNEIKLHIYRSLVGDVFITVRYQKRINPSLADVQEWRNILMIHANRNLSNQGKPTFQEIESHEDILNGQSVIRRKYGNGETLLEDIYIARSNDMIIITLAAEENEFNNYSEDFEAIVASFRPLE